MEMKKEEETSFRDENATEFADRICASEDGCNPFSREDIKFFTAITKNYNAIGEFINKLMEANFSEFKIGIALQYLLMKEERNRTNRMKEKAEEKVKEQQEEIEEYVKMVEESLDLIAKQQVMLDKCDYIFEGLIDLSKKEKIITPETVQMAIVMKGLIDLSKKEKVNKEREEKRKKAGFGH